MRIALHFPSKDISFRFISHNLNHTERSRKYKVISLVIPRAKALVLNAKGQVA